jgi:iron complex outermembrane receptor protein
MNNKRLLCIAIGMSCMGATVHAGAAALEEVIITAQKTEETIQSVPISIQALDSKMLENNSVNSFSDIKALVPSLRITAMPTSQANLLVSIRGIPPGAVELTQDTPTAIHINGVYIARGNGLDMSVADLERMEVLRGPQGTLYGRNATAGAINMVTAKPTDEFAFKQQVTVAEQDQRISKTSVNVPLTDQVYAKFAYMYDDKEGYVDNSAPDGIDFGDRTAQAARFDLRWVPTNDLTIDYSYDWSNQRYYTTPGQCMERGTGSLSAAMDPDQCDDSFKDELAFYGHAPKNKVTAQGHTLAVEWDLSDDTTLRSITAYRKINDNYYGLLFAGGANFINGAVDVSLPGGLDFSAEANHTKQHQFSQELQLLGDLGDRVQYSTGLYYFRERGTETKGFGPALVAVTPSFSLVSLNGPRDLEVANDSTAVFGQLTWTPPVLDDALEVIPGIRFTRDKREASMFERRGGAYMSFGGAPFTPNNSGSNTPVYTGYPDVGAPVFSLTGRPAEFDESFSKTTPSLTLQYHIDQDIMSYAKYVKGYKSGGTAVRASSTGAFEEGFAPETLESYEVGIKSSWLDQRLRVNANVFQSKFEDQQVNVRNQVVAATGTASVPFDIFNAGKSTYDGAELEIQAAITDNFRLSANYAYLHFKYDEVKDPATGADVTDYYHNVVPKNAYSIAADYSVPDLGFGVLDINLTYSHTDRAGIYQDAYTVSQAGVAALTAEADTRQFVTPSYGIWNGRIALSEIKVGPNDKGSLAVALWGRNLADKEYESYNYVTIAQAAQYQAFWGEPRTLGIDVVYKYE